MNPITVGIGAASFAFGVYTLIVRAKRPEKFAKLEAMRKAWGQTAGTVIHVVAYSVVPLLFGVYAILAGLRGQSIF
jgi:hypothetical protein